MTDNDNGRGNVERFDRPEHEIDEPQSPGAVEDLGERRLHPGALTGSEHDEVHVCGGTHGSGLVNGAS
jgi:hypothetical protein